MKFVLELQRPIWLCSYSARPEVEVEVVVRHVVGPPEIESPIGRSAFDVMSYAYVAPPSPTYEISFTKVIVSSLSEEFAFKDDETEIGEGAQFARFEKSKYLDFINDMCYEQDILGGSRYHYVISCYNGRIDVVTRESPMIRLIGQTSR